MKKHSASVVVWLLAIVAAAPGVVSAQQRPQNEVPPPPEVRRPYRGLFGGPADPNTPQSLAFTMSVYGAHDDNVTAGLGGQEHVDSRLQRSGNYLGVTAGLEYTLSKSGDKVDFGLSSGVSGNGYWLDDDRSIVPHAYVSGEMVAELGQQTFLEVKQQAIYSEYYRFQLFPTLLGPDDDGALIADPDIDLFEQPSFRYVGGASIEHQLNRRDSIRGAYGYSRVGYQSEALRDWESHRATIQYRHRVSSHMFFHFGYGYRTASSSSAGRRGRQLHDLDIGVDYSRALSLSRRTSFSFGTGSAVVVTDRLNVQGGDPLARLHLIGNAVLTHELGRTWTAYAYYNRGFIFREGFDDPFLTNALSVGLSGLVSRRLDVSLIGHLVLAHQDVGENNRYDSVVGSANARYALTRFLAAFAEFVYYTYEFEDDIILPPGYASALDRRGLRLGLTASVPLIR